MELLPDYILELHSAYTFIVHFIFQLRLVFLIHSKTVSLTVLKVPFTECIK